MTSISCIINNEDIINYIYSLLCSVDDKSAVPCVNKTLKEQFKKKSYFAIQQDNLRLEITNKYHDIFICVNAECREEYNNFTEFDIDYSLDRNLNIKKVVGNVIFFYPKYLTRYVDNNNYINSIEYILDRWYRHEQCKNAQKVKRFIPYCERCMHKYVNYGYREDNQEVPYGYTCEYIKNI